MKIVYDASILGAGYQNPLSRTGVFRVIENLAFGLSESTDLDLTFCSGSSFQQIFNTLDYLDATPSLSKVPLAHDLSQLKAGYQLHKLRKNLTARINSSPFYFQRMLLRGAKKGAALLESTVESLSFAPCKADFSTAHIYHSPFDPIPDSIRTFKRIQEFLTVYDLIPILYPDFFKLHEGSPVEQAVSTLTPASWVLCISHATRNDLCNYSQTIDPEKVIVTHLAASDKFYPCTNSQQLAAIRHKYQIPDAPYILSLSTLEPRKNIDHAIRSFLQLIQQEKLADLNLVLVGTKGWNYDQIFAAIRSNPELEKRIIVTGYVADEDLAPLYSGAIAFVYPSFYEGFGLPPLEAMQCGVPVITSNTSSLPEVVGDAGIMLDPRDSDGLCQSLLKLYYDSELRSLMAQKSLEQAKRFSWERCTQETIQAYKMALNH